MTLFLLKFDSFVSEPLGSGPVIGVIVVVIVVVLLIGIAIVARSKGILCFAGKIHIEIILFMKNLEESVNLFV